MNFIQICRLVLSAALAYVIGTLSTATLIARANGIDIRQVGSGNPGGTNVMRVLGAKYGLIVMVLDGLKGLVAVLLAFWLSNFSPEGAYIAKCLGTLGVLMGHNWPVFERFRGGKGVATTLGALMILSPWAALLGIVVLVPLFWRTRLMSLASLLGVAVATIAMMLLPKVLTNWAIVTGAFLLVACIFKHRSNISRLLSGTETPLSGRKKVK